MASAAKIGLLVLVVLLPVMLPRSSGQFFLPSRPLGFVYAPNNDTTDLPIPPITLTLFIDNTCGDSKRAFPTVVKVADHFGPSQVRLVTHLFSLPYHRNSHVIAKGAHVIDAYRRSLNDTTTKAVYDWIQIVFDNLKLLTPVATAKLNDEQVLLILAPLAQNVSGIAKDKFMKEVYAIKHEISAIYDFKYSCTRGVYGTPTFMLNDVIYWVPSTHTHDQWVKRISYMLNKGNGH